MACSVYNLTSTGAGPHVGTTFGLPRVFQLNVDGEPQARHCRAHLEWNRKGSALHLVGNAGRYHFIPSSLLPMQPMRRIGWDRR